MALSEPEIWLAFASAAVSGFVSDDEYEDDEELAAHVVEQSSLVADAMLEAYKDRFVEKKPRGRMKRRAKEEDDDEDEG